MISINVNFINKFNALGINNSIQYTLISVYTNIEIANEIIIRQDKNAVQRRPV